MTNGKKDSKSTLPSMKRISDLVPVGEPPKTKKSIKDFIGDEMIIESVRDITGSDGIVKGVSTTFTIEGERHTIPITHRRVMSKLRAVRNNVPIVAVITKGARYYDIS